MTKSKHLPKTPVSAARPATDILRDMDAETISHNGEVISMAEAGIRLLYGRSLKGDMAAALELERIRSRSGAEVAPKPVGCLLVPEPMTMEEFAKMAFKQQAKFRERDYGKEDS